MLVVARVVKAKEGNGGFEKFGSGRSWCEEDKKGEILVDVDIGIK